MVNVVNIPVECALTKATSYFVFVAWQDLTGRNNILSSRQPKPMCGRTAIVQSASTPSPVGRQDFLISGTRNQRSRFRVGPQSPCSEIWRNKSTTTLEEDRSCP
jgi:hypothetical protein